MYNRTANLLLDLLFPNRCPVCGSIIGACDLLCSACKEEIVRDGSKLCTGCGKAPCICSILPHAYDRTAAVCIYPAHGTREAISALKGGRNRNFAIFSAQQLAEKLSDTTVYGHPDCIMPVPMHWVKQHFRGYNQAALIGKEIARCMGIPYREDVLFKKRSPEQHSLSAEERRKNAECIGIREKNLDGMHIVLCDDVLTTGSTMDRCAMLLKSRGAAAVIAAAAASTMKVEQEEPE